MRELFLLDPDIIFLNHGSYGACPQEVFDVYQRWQREMEKNPVEFLGRRSAGLLLEARKSLSHFVGAQPENLVFIPNATTGVNTVARSLALKTGDEILTTDHEYGACDNTWYFLCRQTGAQYIPVRIPLPFSAAEFPDRILSAITPRTRMIYLSHITSTTALIFPVQEICRKARAEGITTLIDGAHAPGQIPLDLDSLGADFYTGNCHKWLCAPKGCAFLYARSDQHPKLHATVISWGYSDEITGHTGFDAYTGSTLFERRLQWQGTRDISAFLTVPAALRFREKYHWDSVIKDCHLLLVETRNRMQALTGIDPVCTDNDFAQMAIIPLPPADPTELSKTLFKRYKIEIPITTHRDRLFVRPSIQGYNSVDDVDVLVGALSDIFRFPR